MAAKTLRMIGVSGRWTPVDMLGRLAITTERLPAALDALTSIDGVDEAAVLSAHNRTEIYLVADRRVADTAVLDLWAGWSGLPSDRLRRSFEKRRGWAVRRHLLDVACGLGSIGASERPMHQYVEQALALARAHGGCGTVLGTVFRQALRLSERIRLETALDDEGSPLVNAAVEAGALALDGLDGRVVMVVGTGQTSRQVASAARMHGARCVHHRSRPTRLETADMVVTCGGSGGHAVSAAKVRAALAGRPERPLAVVDLSVPAGVDPLCGRLDNVTVIDIATALRLARGVRDLEEATCR